MAGSLRRNQKRRRQRIVRMYTRRDIQRSAAAVQRVFARLVMLGLAEVRQHLGKAPALATGCGPRSEEHTSELQSLMRISYAVFCLKKKRNTNTINHVHNTAQL